MIVIVIPAYNPNKKLLSLVNELMENEFKHIVVVNDGSEQSSSEIFRDLSESQVDNVAILNHCVNLGKGRALKTGINFVMNNYPDCIGIVTVDADGQHSIEDIKKMANTLKEKSQDNNIVLGCRLINNMETKVPLRSRIGNWCTKYILRYLCNVHVSDSQTGLRAIPLHLLPRLMTVQGERYEYETNMLLELIDEDVKIIEVPIETIYEDNNSTSHFNPIKDSIKIYTVILKYSMASLLSAVLDNLTFIFLTSYCNNIWLMTFAGRVIAAIFNFSINKKVVFKKEGNVWRQSIKYMCLVLASGTVSAVLVQVLHYIFCTNVILLKIIIEMILYFINFYIQKNFVFNKDKNGKRN